MIATKIFLDTADTTETKAAVGLVPYLSGQYVAVADLVAKLIALRPAETLTIEAIRVQQKLLKDSIAETFTPEKILLEELLQPQQTADELVESVYRASLWGRSMQLVLPMNLEGIEAAHTLARSAEAIAFAPVTSVSQAAAVYVATREARQGVIKVILPIDTLYEAGMNGTAVAAGIMNLGGTSGPPLALYLRVHTLATFVWGIEQNVAGLIAPLSVLQAWKAAQFAEALGDTERAYIAAGTQPVVTTVDVTTEKNSFAISNEITTTLLKRQYEAWSTHC